MMRLACFAACAAGMLTVSAFGQQPNQLTPSEAASGWELLFDGQSTEHWRNYKQQSVNSGWQIRDGALVRAADGAGNLVSKEQYDSFELLLEYRIAPGGNSGVLFHVQETADEPWMTGPEIQIQDDVAGTDPQKSGWLYQLAQPGGPGGRGGGGQAESPSRPAGEWNLLYVRVTPRDGEIRLNGWRYVTFNRSSPDWQRRLAASKFAEYPNFAQQTSGHISLQDHGDEVAFRNIRVRRLAQGQDVKNPITGHLPLKPVAAFPNLKWAGWEPEDEQGRQVAFRTIFLTAPNDDSNRVWVGEQHGRIWSFQNSPDVTESKLLLDLREKVIYSDRSNEEGLLGIAVHPQFKENGHVFLYYTLRPGRISVISRFTISKDNPDALDPASEKEILRIEQPFPNHNGGTICFGPDGYLYIALGDGGSRNDPYDAGQSLNTLLGKVLRIDVNKEANGKAYAIPADNPFADGANGALPEIFCYGVRNFWRMAFDRETGVLWAGEVGQETWEEINILQKGGNYGWNRREGLHPFGTKSIDRAAVIDPIWEYDHQVGKSITGGSVYRGKANPELVGKYVYADYVTGKIWALQYDMAQQKVISNESLTTDNNVPILSFGEDANGEIYYCIVAANGRGVYKFVKE